MKWGLVIGLSAVGVGLGWLNYIAGERVEQMRMAIVEAGHPIHLKDYYKESVPDSDNAYLDVQKWRDEIMEADIAVSGSAKKQTPFLGTHGLNEEDVKELAAIMAKHQLMSEGLIQAAEQPQLRLPIDTDNAENVSKEMLDRVQEFRSIARVLSANVRLKIAEGKLDEAMNNAVAILKWSRLVGQQPTLVSYLVAIALRGIGIQYAAEVLYAGSLEEGSLSELEEVLQSFDTNAQWKSVVYSEIPFFVDVFYPSMPVATRHLWFSLQAEADYLFTMRSVAEKPLVQDGLFVNALPGKDADHGRSWIFVSVMPALQATQEAAMRVEAQTRCLMALLQWRRLGGVGQDIKEFGLNGAWAKDPYDGGVVKMQPSEFGPVFYVTGSDREDDGGGKAIVAQREDVGIIPMAMQAQLAAE